jgi:hypothetical protein
MSQTKAQLLDNIKDNVQLDAQKALRFADSDSSHYVAFRAPGTVSSSVTWTLPSADGSANYVLATDGSGNLSWIADPAGQWVTSGSNVYFSAGNVGIGDSSPSNPLSVTGASAFNGDVTFTGASYNVTWDKSADDLIFNDNAKAAFGTGSDLEVYHDSTNNQIKSTNGKVVITTTAGNSDIEITPNGSGNVKLDGLAWPNADGSANQVLKTDGSAALSWVTVTSTTINSNTNNYLITGTGTADTLQGEADLTFDGTTLKAEAANPILELSGTAGSSGNTFMHINANANHWCVGADNYTSQNMFVIKDGTPASSTHRFCINSSGNVGIGTTSPSTRLSVTGANGDLLKFTSAGTEAALYLDNNEFRVKVDPDDDEATSIYTVEIDGTLALRLQSGGDIHLGNWSSQSNVYGKARVNIRGADDIATSFNLANSYLHIGGQESTLSGLYPISFGHTKADSTKASSYIGAQVYDSAGYEKTALTFATRDATSDTTPTERSRITPKGSHIYYGKRYGIYTRTGVSSYNGSTINVQYLEDELGVWMVVAKIQQSSHLTAAMASVAQIDVTNGQATGTEWSSAWGDTKPLAVRYISCSNWDEWGDNRGVDFIQGVPNNREWKKFMTSGQSSGFKVDVKLGWDVDGAFDGKGRWRNPEMDFMRLSDPSGTIPTINEDFFEEPTAANHANALNLWGDRYDAKFAVVHDGTTGGQDANCSQIYGYDDNVYTHEDNFPNQPANSGGTNLAAMPLWICLNMGVAQYD